MTQAQVNEQIRVIQEGTKIVTRTKESALAFLMEAGFVKADKKPTRMKTKK